MSVRGGLRSLRTAVSGRADSALSAMGAVGAGGCDGPWWTWSYSACAASTRTSLLISGKLLNHTTEFVPHDEAQLLEAALAISSTDDDDDWRASLRRKAPRMALDATTLKNLEVLLAERAGRLVW